MKVMFHLYWSLINIQGYISSSRWYFQKSNRSLIMTCIWKSMVLGYIHLSPSVANSLPSLGKTMMYSVLHCGQATLAVLLPFCFSSIQRCRHSWWTHLVVPLQRQGLTQGVLTSSSSVAKHTQQVFLEGWIISSIQNLEPLSQYSNHY